MYCTAEGVSSNDSNKNYSYKLVDTLLLNNGYDTRVLERIKKKREEKKKEKKTKQFYGDKRDHAILKLPYLNDVTSRKYKDAVRHSGLPIKIVETPGERLRDLLTDSRPLDKDVCITNNCKACEALESGNCMSKDCIYHIICTKHTCKDNYGGETGRPLCKRFEEHYRSAANPTAKSYKDCPLAKHYAEKHPDQVPSLKLEIIDRGNSLINRKIKEAKFIKQNQPTLNDKKELQHLQQFLVE